MNRTISAFALALFIGGTMLAADTNNSVKSTVDQLLTEARQVKKTADELSNRLKAKNADLTNLAEPFSMVEKGAANIQNLVGELHSASLTLNSKQKARLDNTKALAELMNVFVVNKKNLLADGASAEDREQLRANAMSVAKRAELIEANLLRMGL